MAPPPGMSPTWHGVRLRRQGCQSHCRWQERILSQVVKPLETSQMPGGWRYQGSWLGKAQHRIMESCYGGDPTLHLHFLLDLKD